MAVTLSPLIGSLLMALVAGQPVPDALVRRLGEHAARVEKFSRETPTVVTIDGRELDGDGKLLHVTRTTSRVQWEGDKRRTTVLAATKDGKDSMKEAQSRAKDGDSQKRQFDSPFTEKVRARYRFTVLEAENADGLATLAFGPSGKKSTELMEGTAVVHVERGEVVSLKGRLSENPAFVDAMETELEYRAETPVGRALSKLRFEGKGGFLFYKRQGGATMTFEYEPAPASEAPAR